jgi:hypothetical protein
MKKIISNAFSLQMLNLAVNNTVSVKPLTVSEAADFAKSAESSVGHGDVAAVMTSELGLSVVSNRRNDRLEAGDQLLVGQFTGGRLPEGATTLPEGVSLTWVLVTIG